MQILKSLFKKKDEDITPANLTNNNIQEEVTEIQNNTIEDVDITNPTKKEKDEKGE